MKKLMSNVRLMIQILVTTITNANFKGFLTGTIYRGPTKFACVPGLNCYSCPGALGSCPIGSFQAVANSRDFSIPFYVGGFLATVGATTGRYTCGYACPFGLVQDLIYKIPLFKKVKKLPLEKYLRKLRYLVLAIFVIILPIFIAGIGGVGNPYFCKYICPSGTLMAGIPLVLKNDVFRSSIGSLFFLKMSILVGTILLSIKTYRPFCKYICPLGAIYGFFNPVAMYKFKINDSCINCNKCRQVCKFDIEVYHNPNSPDCIRCGDCIRICPTSAIETPYTKALKNKKDKLGEN